MKITEARFQKIKSFLRAHPDLSDEKSGKMIGLSESSVYRIRKTDTYEDYKQLLAGHHKRNDEQEHTVRIKGTKEIHAEDIQPIRLRVWLTNNRMIEAEAGKIGFTQDAPQPEECTYLSFALSSGVTIVNWAHVAFIEECREV